MNKKIKNIILVIACIVVIGGICLFGYLGKSDLEYMQYKDFFTEMENGNVKTALIEDDKVQFTINDKTYYTDNPNYEGFKEKLLLKGIAVEESSAEESFNFVFDLLFYAIFFGAIILGVGKFVGAGRETFKVVRHTKVKFDDIAGMDELKKEMMTNVDVLKNPEEYAKKGIRQTKGIILEGNPGNGKTLFAKALAEEANINFIAAKGADFQSAMMSVGSRKIKTLFKKAKKHKPCIIFIDEFDSIGERRNYAGTGVDKENNRIITTMLNEMDGFETQDGILVIAATNSYSSLDPALIRPGRFDLKYNIPNPDLDTRIKLIDLYTSKNSLAEDVDKSKLAQAFEHLSCSAIETILNEASMLAIMNKQDKISLENIIDASKKTNCNIYVKKLK